MSILFIFKCIFVNNANIAIAIYLFIFFVVYAVLSERTNERWSCRRNACGLLRFFFSFRHLLLFYSQWDKYVVVNRFDRNSRRKHNWVGRLNGFIVEQRSGIAIYNNFINIKKNNNMVWCRVFFSLYLVSEHDVFAYHILFFFVFILFIQDLVLTWFQFCRFVYTLVISTFFFFFKCHSVNIWIPLLSFNANTFIARISLVP